MSLERTKWFLIIMLVTLVAGAGAALAAPAKVYVADEEGDTVSVLDAASFSKIATIPVGREPHNVQVSPDGRRAWVTINYESSTLMPKREHEGMTGAGQVWVIDTATDQVAARVPVGRHPAHVVLTPDGRFAYVTNGGENTVSVVDTDTRHVVATIPVGTYPHGIRISPDGKQAYVANLKGGTVSVIDTEARKELAQIPVGKGPAQVGFTPDGRLAFASLSQEEKVAVIDPASRKVIKKVAVGTVPIQVYATPDSRLLFVANQGTKKRPGKTVSVINLETLEAAKTIETGPGAHGVVVDRDGRYAYVTNIYANSVSVLDVKDLKVVATIPVGKGPNGISLTP